MYEYRVKSVLAVVDGDTIDVDIDLGFNISYTQRVRLAGIDTPESRTKDKEEKVLGLEVKELLKKTLKDAKNIVIRTEKPDSTEKYGRILGWGVYRRLTRFIQPNFDCIRLRVGLHGRDKSKRL
jgi:micrococcal nuclease